MFPKHTPRRLIGCSWFHNGVLIIPANFIGESLWWEITNIIMLLLTKVFWLISDNARMLESWTIQTSDLWVPNSYVWRFQYNHSKSVHGIDTVNQKQKKMLCIFFVNQRIFSLSKNMSFKTKDFVRKRGWK